MIKNFTIFLALSFLGFTSVAQIPSGYYNTATGSCSTLKDQLYNIISTGQVSLTYGQLDNNQMPIVDTMRSDDGASSIIWDIYSNYSAGPEPYTFNSSQAAVGGFCGATSPSQLGTCWNKEHTFPKAWFQVGSSNPLPAYADLFIVRPVDYQLNAKRANNPYATVGSASWQFPTPGVYASYPMPPNPVLDRLGPSNAPGVSIPTAYEPPNGVKGDLARAYFYIMTRYQNDMGSWATTNSGTGIEYVVDASNALYPSFNLPYLTMLYNWHVADPVDARETNRNNLIYTQQGNRNPYIDHPEYVSAVWQCTGVIPVTITSFTAVKKNESVLLNWYATYETNFKEYEIQRSTDGINFSSIGTVKGTNLSNYAFTDQHLPIGPVVYYRLKMIDIDGKYKLSRIAAVRFNNDFSNAIVYPNPTAGALTIKLFDALESNSVLQVTDIAGRKMKQENVAAGRVSINIDVKNLPEGRYFIKIYNGTQLVNQSFVKLR